jgi:hypothetical protein
MWLVLAGLLFLGATAALGAAPTGKTLRYKCEPGLRAVYGTKFSMTGDVKSSEGDKSHMTQSAQTTCLVEYLGDTASGDFGAMAEVQGGSLAVKIDGETDEQPFEGSAAEYVLNRLGRIKSLSWLSEDPSLETDDQIDWTPSPDEVFLLGGAGILPEKPVKKGDTWKGSVKIPGAVMGEDETIEYRSTLLGEERYGGAVCSKIKTKATVAFTASEDVPDLSGKVTAKARVTGDYTWLFDPARGMIVKTDSVQKVTFSINITMDGNPLVSVSMTGTINSNHKLKEVNGQPVL